MHNSRHLALLPAFLALLSTSASADVIQVGGVTPDFTDIQPAVDAAHESDILLVSPGHYSGFTISAKSLTVVGRQPFLGDPVVDGELRIESLGAGQRVVIKGLDVHASLLNASGLTVFLNQGAVRIESVDAYGGLGSATYPPSSGAYVSQCADIAFTDCLLVGGGGFAWPNEGGAGLSVQTSSIELAQCSLIGGVGADAPAGMSAQGSRGGPGMASLQTLGFASQLQIFGGNGGNGSDAIGDCTQGGVAPGNGGDGGFGLVLFDATDSLRLAPGEIAGGGAGLRGQGVPCSASDGNTGIDIYQEPGSTLTQADVPPTLLQCTQIVHSNDPIGLFVYGEPDSRVNLTLGAAPAFVDAGGLRGIELVSQPLRRFSLGAMPATGFLSTSLPAVPLPPGVEGQVLYLQVLVHNAQGARWSGTTTLIVIDPSF